MTAFSDAVLALSPSVHYRLDESSGNPQDSSGNGRHIATVYGSPTYGVAGYDGTGMTFAANSMLETGDNDLWDMGTGDFSVMFAIKGFAYTGSTQNIIGHDGAGNTGQWFVYLPGAANLVRLRFNSTGGYDWSPTGLNDGGWHLVIITVDRDSATGGVMYKDGDLVSSVDVTGGAATDLTNARPLRIAAANSSGSSQFSGSLDEIAIWKGVALSAANVASLFSQYIRPDADAATGGWATAPLWSKVSEATADGTVITATAS